jgi:phage terminase large subunit GpA-like protein
MIKRLEWRAHNEAARREHRSFWIWSVYSVLQSFERIFREWLKAKGDGEAEKTFLNDTCGKAYRAQSEAPPWEKLRDRGAVSPYKIGQVPAGFVLLFMGIDCQIDRVECHVVAFGRDFRRAAVDYRVIPGHITDKGCQEKLSALLTQTYPNAFGNRLPIELSAIDGNAWTEDVWAFVRRHPASKLIMVRGDGRDTAPRFARVRRERNERTGKLLKYATRFYNVGVSILKMALYRDLSKEDPLARGAVQFPSGLDDEYFRQLTAERREAEKRHGFRGVPLEKRRHASQRSAWIPGARPRRRRPSSACAAWPTHHGRRLNTRARRRRQARKAISRICCTPARPPRRSRRRRRHQAASAAGGAS